MSGDAGKKTPAADAGNKTPAADAGNKTPAADRGRKTPSPDRTPDPARDNLPRSFGRYVLFDLIGKGGMAEIYLARARTEESGGARLVVVKQILPELSANAKFADALVAEAKLAARLSHVNVVQVLDLGRAPESDGSRLFITMEYVEGLDLNDLLRRCARAKIPLPVEFALLMVMETLRGLDYAHRRTDDAGRGLGIVHRDVSPSNVIVSVDGEVKLCDFGIARANDVTDEALAGPGDALAGDAIQGKAGYMSPEHARGEPIDARADIFAAGVILWELLAGRRLYKAGTGGSLLDVARRAVIPELPSRGLALEDDLHGIVRQALAINRGERYQSAASMLDALQRYIARAKLMASPIRLGEWLTLHFGGDLVEARRARERAVKAIEAGPVATVTPVIDAPTRLREVRTSHPTSLIPEPEIPIDHAPPAVDETPPPSSRRDSPVIELRQTPRKISPGMKIPPPPNIPKELPAPPPAFRPETDGIDGEAATGTRTRMLVIAAVVMLVAVIALGAMVLRSHP